MQRLSNNLSSCCGNVCRFQGRGCALGGRECGLEEQAGGWGVVR